MNTIDGRSIEVQGKSKISCRPDRIILSFMLSVKSPDYSSAFDELNKNVQLLRESLNAAGIKNDEIKTSSFSIRAETKHVKGNYVHDGYTAFHSLILTIPIEKELVNNALIAITHSGIASEISISFTLSNSEIFKDQVISQAVLKAAHNAEIISKAAKVTLGPIINIKYGWSEVVFRDDPINMVCEESYCSQSAPDIEPNDIEIEESVTIIYSIS